MSAHKHLQLPAVMEEKHRWESEEIYMNEAIIITAIETR